MSVHDPSTNSCGVCGGDLHTGTYTYCSFCDTQETWDAEKVKDIPKYANLDSYDWYDDRITDYGEGQTGGLHRQTTPAEGVRPTRSELPKKGKKVKMIPCERCEEPEFEDLLVEDSFCQKCSKELLKDAESSDKCSECDGDLEDGFYSTYQCSDCYQDGCELCMDDFCGDCDRCDECCECKCSVCGDSDWQMTETDEGNVCRGCYDYCYSCSERRHPKQMVQNELCKPCAENMNRCEACSDYITDTYNERTCVECGEYYCEWCEDNNMTQNDDEELVCLNCVDTKSKKSAESPTFTPEEGYKCDGCGITIDEGVNFQDIDVHWYIEDGDFTGAYELKNHLGNYNDFFCYPCAEKEGFMAEGSEKDIPQVELHNPIETGIKLSIGSMIAVVGLSAIGGAVLGLLNRTMGDE